MPFGMVIKERTWSAISYTFGYSGMMEDVRITNEDCGCPNISSSIYTTSYRQYDARLGRWQSVDPAYQYFPDQSQYSSNFNSPIYLNDPDGDCPLCGFLISAGLDYAIQQYEIYNGTRTEVDYESILVSGVMGAAGVGIAHKIHKIYKVSSTTAKVNKTVIKVAAGLSDAAVDAGVSAGTQYIKTGEISGTTVAQDVLIGSTVGRAAGYAAKNYAAASKKGVALAKEAKRNTRVAKNNPKPSRNAAAEASQQKLDGFLNSNTTSASVAASNTGSAVVDEVKEHVQTAEVRAAQMIKSKDVTTSYVYSPERIGNTTYYYLNKDHTQVYDTSSGTVHDIVDGKTVFNRRERLDMSKDILYVPGG